MKRDIAGAVIAFFVSLSFFLALFAGVSQSACSTRWKSSGIPYRWQPVGGCQVEISPGQWVPEENVRFSDLKGLS